MTRSSSARSNLKYVLVDTGYRSDGEFCSALLATGDFEGATLKGLRARGGTKQELANDAAARIMSGTLDPAEMMLAFCRQSRQWLSFKIGSTAAPLRPQKDARAFLTTFGEEGWYGPFPEPSGDTTWYVFAKRSVHKLYVDEGLVQKFPVRWHVVAEVSKTYVAFHWNNFSHVTSDEAERSEQFEYWEHIPKAFDSLADELDGNWHSPLLHDVILNRVRRTYKELVKLGEIKFDDVRVRAEREGVALNAHSGPTSEFNIAGLQSLSSALARAVLNELNLPASDDTLSRVDSCLLETLIQHWGTKSYECRIEEQGRKVFRAHCYFGTRGHATGATSPDCLQHILCFKDFGGSVAALRFLLPFVLQ